MKHLVAFLVLIFLIVAAPAFASTFGPAQSTAEPGRFSVGAGIFHYTGNLEFDDDLVDDELDQTRFYATASYGLSGGYEVYIRLGGSDLEYEGSFVGEDTLESDAAPFGSIGLKGPVHAGKTFDLGFFVEGTVFGGYDEDETIGGIDVEIDVDPSWQADLGLTFQKEVEGAYLYGGPVLYYRTGDVDISTSAGDFSDSYTEENFFGAFLGAHWALKNGVKINLESQFKSEVSFGATVSYSFQ